MRGGGAPAAQRGAVLMLVAALLAASLAWFAVSVLTRSARSAAEKEVRTGQALAKARHALLAYVAVALGGFGNVPATLLAGVLVGLTEVFAGLLIAPAMKYAVVFLLYLAVVLWRPQGLFGRF